MYATDFPCFWNFGKIGHEGKGTISSTSSEVSKHRKARDWLSVRKSTQLGLPRLNKASAIILPLRDGRIKRDKFLLGTAQCSSRIP